MADSKTGSLMGWDGGSSREGSQYKGREGNKSLGTRYREIRVL